MLHKHVGYFKIYSNFTNIGRHCKARYINSWHNLLRHEAINNEAEKTLYRNIYARIKACGPITVADYMKEVLTQPSGGYYMSKDVIGPQGDFITSPEISQLFGELVAVWIINEWHKITPHTVQLVELGPGRGTLSHDILRVINHFKLHEKITLHLVEISPKLAKIQAEKLCMKFEELTPTVNEEQKSLVTHYMKGTTKSGINVFWYYSVKDVPKSFSIFLAHEFFDALPIHKFQKSEGKWHEVMIDIDSSDSIREKFRYVLLKGATPGTQFYIDVNEERSHLEVSPQSLIIVDHISNFLNENGGFSLIVDYGHDGDNKDSFRAFRQHRQHDPLLQPGSADLTADVDFSLFKKVACRDERLICFGPVEQNTFLQRMGIDLRMERLIKNASEVEKKTIQRGYNMIMNDDKMGLCFKALAMFPAVLKEYLKKFPVAGFYEPPQKK